MPSVFIWGLSPHKCWTIGIGSEIIGENDMIQGLYWVDILSQTQKFWRPRNM